MSSEQKTLLGFISKRQLIYLLVGGLLLYNYIPFIFNVFSSNWFVAVIFCIIAAMPTIAIIGLLAFFRLPKLHLNFDHFLIIKFSYKKNIGVWTKYRKSLGD
ncbi:PrgI family mobile element protein [Bacillus altitudinis]|uniref:PrgI family mobile element protein n=1 Tax=Bacillus altitudinis TaxID=293387 RepID=UPI002281432F|nr:PrgI family protein [Bacillus altitudinis]MCY7454329.1 PrgI family protein [Bacillus altitudinis]